MLLINQPDLGMSHLSRQTLVWQEKFMNPNRTHHPIDGALIMPTVSYAEG